MARRRWSDRRLAILALYGIATQLLTLVGWIVWAREGGDLAEGAAVIGLLTVIVLEIRKVIQNGDG